MEFLSFDGLLAPILITVAAFAAAVFASDQAVKRWGTVSLPVMIIAYLLAFAITGGVWIYWFIAT